MATGVLGKFDLASSTDTIIYTCPDTTFTIVTINVCNRSISTAGVNIAISETGTVGVADYIEFSTQIVPNGVLERTGIVLNAGNSIIVRADIASVTAIAYGIETSTV